MGCACKNRGKRETYTVTLPGGLKVTKNSEKEATTFAGRHPGATVKKTGS